MQLKAQKILPTHKEVITKLTSTHTKTQPQTLAREFKAIKQKHVCTRRPSMDYRNCTIIKLNNQPIAQLKHQFKPTTFQFAKPQILRFKGGVCVCEGERESRP